MTSLVSEMAEARSRWTGRPLHQWYTPEQARSRREIAMSEQAARVADEDFGRAFRDLMDGGVVADPLAWANRRIEPSDGHWCITGIRFRRLDVTKPFVDVVATSLPPEADALARLADAVVPRYAAFAPLAPRVDAPEPAELVDAAREHPWFAGASVDQYAVAALVADLRARPRHAAYDRVALQESEVDHAQRACARLYAEAAARRPDLDMWATPSTADELQDCAAEGLLFTVTVDGVGAGVVAARRDDDRAMTGLVVQEIVLDDVHRGRRLAPAVLQRLVDELPAGDGDTLWGTIHADNQPSLRNALSTGRVIVGGDVWLTPPGLAGM